MNINAGTKLYLSTLVTLRAVFATVDVYPDWADPGEAQAIAVAMPATGPTADALMERALALQQRHRFRYPMPALVAKRAAAQSLEGGDLLTDDFAPINLYETIPVRPPRKRQ